MAECQGRDVAKLTGQFDGKCDQVILADGDQLDREGELVRLFAGVNIFTDELAGFAGLAWCYAGQEIDHFLGVVPCREEKVQAVLRLLDVDCILVRAILQHQLLQVEERPLVRHLLSNLNCSSERMVGKALHAVRTLLCRNHVLHLEGLLDNRALESLLLDRDLDLDTPRVGFSPDETGIDDSDFGQATESAQTDRQQLLRLRSSHNPAVRWLQPSLAVLASMESGFALNALGDVDGELHTVLTQCASRCGSINSGTTVTAENTEERLVSSPIVRRKNGSKDKGLDSRRSSGLLLLQTRHVDGGIQIHRHLGVGNQARIRPKKKGLKSLGETEISRRSICNFSPAANLFADESAV